MSLTTMTVIEMMKKLLKILTYGLLSMAVFIAFIIYTAEITTETTIYSCEGKGRYSQSFVNRFESQIGKMANPNVDVAGFLKIESQTREVFLLSKSIRYSIAWEKPNESIYYWHNVTEVADQLQLNDYDGSFEGGFSQISKSFSFLTRSRDFEGMCKKVEQ